MTPERWEKIEQLFHRAAERTGEERAAYLQSACLGDAELRREVESLLAHGKTADGWLGGEALKEMAEEVLDGASGVSLSGQRLGPYQVLSSIGVGGMGEVYRARDTRLDRLVAIKVLPKQVVQRKELRERLEREARTIASLNHVHICALYDVGHQDGVDYLVLEYLEGETLAERLQKGPLPLVQVLEYAIEIADALEKAHRKGITHRDLKPGNIMLTKSGTKLLDFGLAKIRQEANPAVSVSQRPTTESDVTAEGTILGTLQYMAPEQVEGKTNEVDSRTDIFAFGAVVYEMATGKKAFEGRSQASLIAKILETDPVPMSSLQPMTPPALNRAVKKCLAKEPDQRWQTASDLRGELAWIASEQASQAATPVASASAKPLRTSWRRTMALGVGAVALLALGGVAALTLRPSSASALEIRTELVTPSTPDPLSLALSPDGRQIVFVAFGERSSQLWLRRLDTENEQPLAGTENASSPFWSPDSRSVGFFADGKLKRVDLAGGSAQTLADATNRGGSWGADGIILFEPTTSSPIFRIPASGGQPVAATTLYKALSHRFPQFVPNSSRFLFYAQGAPGSGGVYLGSLDSSETKRLAASDAAGAYLPGGWLLFIRAGTLFAQRLDVERGDLTGDPITIADPVAYDATTFTGGFSASASGLLAYRRGGAGQTQLNWFDRSGKVLGSLGPPDASSLNGPRLSPDGRRAAVHRTVQNNTDIWIADATRTTRFTFDPSLDRYPVWSPDGSQIVFDSTRTGLRNLYVKSANGAGEEQPLVESSQSLAATDWSRDGQFILCQGFDGRIGTPSLWVVPLLRSPSTASGPTPVKPFLFLKSAFDIRSARFSPDQHWIAYESNESGRYEIYVRPFAGLSSGGSVGGQWQISASGGLYPRWRSDGKELYFVSLDGKLMAASINSTNSASFESGTPVVLFQARMPETGSPTIGPQYDVAPDGRFLINTVVEDANAPITLVQNWKPEAKK